jgi:hypothetical protein
MAISPPPLELEFPPLPFALPLWLISVELLPVVLAPLPLEALPAPLLLLAPEAVPVVSLLLLELGEALLWPEGEEDELDDEL